MTNNQNLTNQFLACFEERLSDSGLNKIAKDSLKRYANAALSALTQSSIPILKDVAGVTKACFDESQKQSLAGLKDKVASALAKSKQKFVFIIDDIDRLTKNEVRELFKTIKVFVDFPNVIYLLAFDCEVVANSLKSVSGEDDGNAYLEKIVQIPFVLPLIKARKFRSIFRKRIEAVVSLYESDNKTIKASEDFRDIYDNVLNQLVRTPRQINRIINTLSALYPTLRTQVALADIVAMECIRMVLPKLYGVIRDNSDYFVLDRKSVRLKKQNFERIDANDFHATWKKDLPGRYRNSAIKIMEILFPQSLKGVSQNSSETWFGQGKRIYEKYTLSAYLRLRFVEVELPEEESTEEALPVQTKEPSNLPHEILFMLGLPNDSRTTKNSDAKIGFESS